MVICIDPNENSKDPLRVNRSKEKKYAFDHAFGPEVSTQYIYDNTTRFLIHGVLNGFNATVFAYGATGAGKALPVLLCTLHAIQGKLLQCLELMKSQG